MRFVISILFLSLPFSVAQRAPLDAQGWLNKGIHEYKSARYQDAAESFQQALALNQNDTMAHLYLATAWMSQYIPGSGSPDNLELARKAEAEFRRVLDVEPDNTTTLASLASLIYQQAQGMPDFDQKSRKLDEAGSWYEKLTAADPQNKEGYYSLAVIDWVKWYAAWMLARSDLGMGPEQPGPLPDPARRQLKQRYSALIEHGISNLERALQIDPQYDDAMAYMNLWIRERGDLADSPEEYHREVETADQWVDRALQVKRAKAQAVEQTQAPQPSPSPATGAPQRIRVGQQVQELNLIRKVDPEYPPLASQARIQGTVRFTAIIGRDGHVQNLQLVSGHPLLVEAARKAVEQWEYRPTLLNGSPVEVVTLIAVNFTLP